MIHQYIATNRLNTNELQNIIDKLQNTYYELAPSSLVLLRDFEQNPKNCDMRNLFDSLALSIKNIHQIIEFKSEDLFPHVKR